jgi:hypothetical protein
MTSAAALFKVHIENMPEALNTKKDIDEYIKEFWKDFRVKDKEAKAADKAAKVQKPKRKKGVDKDGNVKEKRAPSQYNIFVKEQYEIIKNTNPELDKTQIFSEIGRIWKEKKGNVDEKPTKKVEELKEEPKEEVDIEIEEEKPVEAPKKKQGRKAIKKKPKDEEKSDEDE